jgi:prepilin-type N-terminal cleavage/methylation domain-containing protein
MRALFRQSLARRLRQNSSAGFGLVELIVVVAILGILVIVAIPVYGAIQDNALAKATQVAANQSYTAVSAAYEAGGRSEAAKVLARLNEQNDMVYLVSDDPINEPRASTIRDEIAYRVAALKDAGVPLTALKDAQTAPGNEVGTLVGNLDKGKGEYLCAIVYSGNPNVKFGALAGPGCDSPKLAGP